MGFLHIYCGDGKGKTTAAAGQALRMAGCGKKAVIVRFLKNEDSGEVAALRGIPQVNVLSCEESFGFTWQMTEKEKQKAAEYYKKQFEAACLEAERCCREAEEGCAVASEGCAVAERSYAVQEKSREEAEKFPDPKADVLFVMDELCAAVNAGLLDLTSVLEFLDSRPSNLEVVVTGRKPHKELLARADYVTEMRLISHPYGNGIPARKGIEY